jgi:hypothetical protein
MERFIKAPPEKKVVRSMGWTSTKSFMSKLIAGKSDCREARKV